MIRTKDVNFIFLPNASTTVTTIRIIGFFQTAYRDINNNINNIINNNINNNSHLSDPEKYYMMVTLWNSAIDWSVHPRNGSPLNPISKGLKSFDLETLCLFEPKYLLYECFWGMPLSQHFSWSLISVGTYILNHVGTHATL